MSFSGACSTLSTHLATAGATLSPKITDVGSGEPGNPPGRCVRWWYEGDGEPVRMGGARTLTDEMVGEKVLVRAYWPVANRDKTVAAALEVDLQAFVRAVKHLLLADSDLGGNIAALDVGPATAGWQLLDSGTWRTVSIPLTFDMVDVDTIAL